MRSLLAMLLLAGAMTGCPTNQNLSNRPSDQNGTPVSRATAN
jgi:hypothetical protein